VTDAAPRAMSRRAAEGTGEPSQVGGRGGRAAWRILLPFAGAYGANIAVAAVGEGRMPLPMLALLMNVAAAAAALALVIVSGRVLDDRRSLGDYGLRVDRQWCINLGVGLCIGILGVAIPFIVGLSAGWFEVAAVFDRGDLPLWPGVGLIVVAMLCVGLWEELIFRGVFVRNIADVLRRWLSPRRAIAAGVVLSAVVFTVGHIGQVAERPAFLVTWLLAGLLFGALYVLSGNLALPIGVHAAFNIAVQAVFVRTDIRGTEGFSAVARIDVDPGLPPLFELGGAVDAAAWICIGFLAALWLRRPRRQTDGLLPPARRG
jgi:uncharacterized protein